MTVWFFVVNLASRRKLSFVGDHDGKPRLAQPRLDGFSACWNHGMTPDNIKGISYFALAVDGTFPPDNNLNDILP